MKGIHQTVDLRTPNPPLGRFGDEATRDAYLARIEEIRRGMTVPYQVAPGSMVKLRDGRILREGDPVRVEDLEGFVNERREAVPAWMRLEQLVRDWNVIARD